MSDDGWSGEPPGRIGPKREDGGRPDAMHNIFYVIGLIVIALAILRLAA